MLLALVGGGLVAGTAMAAPISGSISFTGDWDAVDSSWAVTTIGAATGISFNDTDGDLFNANVQSATADFAGLVGFDNATFQDFQFSPFSASIDPLWSVNDFWFELNTLNVDYQSDSALVLSGYGTITATGFDATPGSFNFSGNSFTWSATSAVPEPATMLLFGTGLIGLVALRRKKDPRA